MGAITADHVGSSDASLYTIAVHDDVDFAVLFGGSQKRRLVFDIAAFASQCVEQELLRYVLGHHGDERIRALFRSEAHMRQRLPMGNHRNRGHAIRTLEEWGDDSRHVEDFERTGKDCEGFRVLRLGRPRLDDAITKTAASAFVGEKQANRAGAYDENIRIHCNPLFSRSDAFASSYDSSLRARNLTHWDEGRRRMGGSASVAIRARFRRRCHRVCAAWLHH